MNPLALAPDPRTPAERFADLCANRAVLVDIGTLTVQQAMDEMQGVAAMTGLVDAIGQDEVQAIMAETFAVPPAEASGASGLTTAELVRIWEAADEQRQTPPPAAPLTLVCPPAWRDVPIPPMRWLAESRIPAADVTILSGDGGGGKTTVALQLAVSVERGLGDWLGTTCETGPVMFFSGEEPEDEMRRRLHRVARSRSLEAAELENLHFHFANPDACLLGISRPNGPMVPTPLFESLCGAALDIRPALIVVDSIAATFGGNQNDRDRSETDQQQG
jgi:hypothetical protein